jgi:hypothetical protein
MKGRHPRRGQRLEAMGSLHGGTDRGVGTQRIQQCRLHKSRSDRPLYPVKTFCTSESFNHTLADNQGCRRSDEMARTVKVSSFGLSR